MPSSRGAYQSRRAAKMTNHEHSELLAIDNLTVQYRTAGRPPFTAVDGVSFTIGHNETVGLVGESGSGKSTSGRAILGLTPVSQGSVHFDGMDITHWRLKQRR